ncbi:MAG TPA: hypothetical protein VHO24_01175 [Opitutaceae bacterium]|nr:hypothetical protein [Opitutaceae bacterium]
MFGVFANPIFAGTTGQQFVAVGSSGQVLTSPDGLAWTPRVSTTSFRLRGVASSPDLFVAAGHNGTILTSPDGVVWTSRSSGTVETLRGTAASSTAFVAVGGNSASSIRRSADGITWNPGIVSASPFTPGALRAVAWGNSQFIAVGSQSTVLTSPDGITWTVRNAGGVERYDGVVWTGTEFVVLTQTGKVLRGTDGISWVTSQSFPPPWIEGITWSDARYIAVGGSGAIKTSPDGVTWSFATSGTTATLHGITWSGPQLVPAGDPVTLLDSINPFFLTLPLTRTIAAGASTTIDSVFSVIGATFQWFKNNLPVPGATGTSLTLNNVQISDIGSYRIEANYFGATYSSNQVALGVLGFGTTGRQFIAVGTNGTLLSSPDGLAWSARTSGSTARLRAVAASNNLFVVVGQGGTVLTSPDGNAWTPRPVSFGGPVPSLRGVAAGPSLFVAVGGGGAPTSGRIISSVNGTTWSLVGGTFNNLRSVVFGNNQFVAVGVNGTILTSTTGGAWTSQTSGTTERLDGIVWTGTQYVVLSQTGKILTSADGIAWASSQGFPPVWLEGIAWNENRYVAVGSSGSPVVYTSTDGDQWSTAPTGTPTPQTLHGVAWSGVTMSPSGNPAALLGNIAPYITLQPLAQSLAAGASSTLNVAVSSLNAAYQWFRNAVPVGGATGSTLPLSNVVSSGVYYAQITAGGVTFTSDNVLVSLLGQGTLGEQFITVGASGTILTSPSGETWTTRTSGTTKRLRGAAAAANVAVAAGETGTILSSFNGAAWTPRSSGTTDTLRGVARNPTHFVAVGGRTTGVVLRSTDGVAWAPQPSVATVPLRAIAWGNDLFVAVGSNGFIMTSPSGASGTWTQRASGVSSTLDGVVWSGSRFTTLTRFGFVLTSTDGITWSPVGQSFPPLWLEGLAWNSGRFVAVGSSGNIATTTDGSNWFAATSNTTNTLHGVAWTGSPAIQAGSTIDLLNSIALNPASDPYTTWAASKGLTPAQSGLTADPDGDGIVNLLEYFLALNPLASEAAGVPTGQIEGGDFAFRFNRSKTAAGVTYRIVTSSDLVTWSPTAAASVLESSTTDLDTYVVRFAMTAPRLFVRLEVIHGSAVVGSGP